MSERTFDRETLLDLTVNVIPLGIILFFVVVFLLVRPWEFDPFIALISMGLLVVPFVALAFLTFVSGRAIAQAEESDETTASDDSFEFENGDESSQEQASADLTAGVTDDGAATDTGSDGDATDEGDGTDDGSSEN